MTQEANLSETPVEAESETQATATLERVFKIGSTLVVEDASMAGQSNEEVQALLAFQHPEVANATIHSTEKDGKLTVEFLKKVGRKG